jgi:hypothetical protein
MRTLALALGLAVLPGCSWIFVEGPPVGHERLRYFDCSTSRAAPIVDTVFGGLYGLAAVETAVGNGSDSASVTVPIVLVEAAAAVVFGVSAVYGYGTTSKCDDAKERWARRVMAAPPPAPRMPSGPRPCGSDVDCAGDRICERGACVLPPETVGPAAVTVPAPSASPSPSPNATPNPSPNPNPNPNPSPTPTPNPAP